MGTGAPRLRADGRNARRMLLLRSMGRVQAKYIHAGLEELFENARRIRRRSECGHNLRVGHRILLLLQTMPHGPRRRYQPTRMAGSRARDTSVGCTSFR